MRHQSTRNSQEVSKFDTKGVFGEVQIEVFLTSAPQIFSETSIYILDYLVKRQRFLFYVNGTRKHLQGLIMSLLIYVDTAHLVQRIGNQVIVWRGHFLAHFYSFLEILKRHTRLSLAFEGDGQIVKSLRYALVVRLLA